MEKLISIIGLTSSGKSDLAIALAQRFNGEIVSADSRQVYRGLDYCSGKVSDAERALVSHHLLDVADLGTQFTLHDFQLLAYEAIDDIISRKKVPFLVGGTGLYSRSVVEGYILEDGSPDIKLREELENASTEDLRAICDYLKISVCGEVTKRRLVRMLEKSGLKVSDLKKLQSGELVETSHTQAEQGIKKQPRFQVLQIGIRWGREKTYERIKLRLERRMKNMIEEIRAMLNSGVDPNFLKQLGLEAKCVAAYILGEYSSYEEFFEDLYKQERHFAKRQQTWYNKEQDTVWLDAEDNLLEKATELVKEFLNKN